MKQSEAEELMGLMAESIKDKIRDETERLFLKIVLFVSLNNILLGALFWGL